MSRNPHLKKAGMVTYDGICSDTSYVLRTKNGDILDEKYLPLILQNERFWKWFEENKSGSVNYLLNWKTLKEYEFELPPIDEQRRIASIIWAIERVRVAYEELIAATDDLVKSQFIEMFGDPNNNANTVSFETAFTIRDDLRKPINDSVRSEMHENAMYPYYGANGQVDTINQYLMDCTALCLAEDCGAYGAGEASSYIVSGKCWVNNHAHVIIPKECCDLHYANAFFKILDMTPYVSGSTRLKLTQGKMKEIPVVLPSIGEQMKFAAIVEQSDKSKFELKQAINSLDIMQKGFLNESE